MKEIQSRLKEASLAILPIVFFIVLINFAIPGFSVEKDGSKFGPVMTSLLISVIPLILGTSLFSIGAEKSVSKIGEIVGTSLTKKKSIVLLLVVGVLMGFLATLAEPDLAVLANRINMTKDWLLIAVAAFGVGVFLMIALLRVIYNKPLKYWLAMGYGLVFALGCFADQDFFSILFDSGGVTTGVITVPFIISLGVGVSRVLGGKNAEDDSFGYSGLCSLGTVLAVMVFSILLKSLGRIPEIQDIFNLKFDPSGTGEFADSMMKSLTSYQELGKLYLVNFLHSAKDVGLSVLPILIFFFVFNIFAKIKGKRFASILIGFLYTYIGMTLFFLGAESGFIPLANSMGAWFSTRTEDLLWLFIFISVLLGFISMMAEPAVRVLAENVAEVSQGVISKKVIFIALGLSTSFALLMNVFRVTYNIDYMYFIIPLFLFAIILSFLSPNIYVGIAIDAAGVATGTMASCFFLPMFIGYAASLYPMDENFGKMIMRNGFGVVGLMSVMPIIAVETVGILAELKMKLAYQRALAQMVEPDDNQIVHLPLSDEKEGE